MRVSAEGIAAIIAFEGLRLQPYNDVAGYATIGVGHLIAKRRVTEADIKNYAKFKREDAVNLFRDDLLSFEKGVSKIIGAVSQNQFDAMVSLAYNIGLGNFGKSSVVKRLKRGDVAGAGNAFLLWNRAGGKVIAGLTKRRESERTMFLRGDA